MNLSDIQVRDPFILADKASKTYCLFGSTDGDIWNTGGSFKGYKSKNLKDFDGPFTLFENTPDFWAQKNFWAPEVHYYRGKYYMFASFFSDEKGRGTQILLCDTPLGRYAPVSSGPVTPEGWMCLDGTLYVDEDCCPWIIFCREWLQVADGEIWCQRLAPDLTRSAGDPEFLFRASQSGWAETIKDNEYGIKNAFVTDGPFVYTTKTGKILLLWSSFVGGRYAIGVARSKNNKINGEYEHLGPLYEDDGGHGMVFSDFNNGLYLSIHKPNDSPNERAVFLPLEDTGETLVLA